MGGWVSAWEKCPPPPGADNVNLSLGHHQQHAVLRMLESRGWVEPLMTEHEPSMLVEVWGLAGAMEECG